MYHPELLMDPWVIEPLNYFELQNRWNSVVNMCYTVAPHSGWSPIQMPPYGMQGGAIITDYEGRILCACPKAAVEGTMQTTLDIGAVRHYRQSMPTHNGLNSFKGGLFDYFKREITYPRHPQIAEDPQLGHVQVPRHHARGDGSLLGRLLQGLRRVRRFLKTTPFTRGPSWPAGEGVLM